MSPRALLTRSKKGLKRALRPLVHSYVERREDLPLSNWRLLRDAEGHLSLDGVRLTDLMSRWGSPLHVVDAQRLDENVAAFTAKPDGASKGGEVYYSYKTNPVLGVLERLHAQNVGAEVISAYELWLALKLGVAPERIVYNGPAKSEASLRQALEVGIGLLNFNAREEIAPFSRMAKELRKKPRVGVRVVVPGGWGGQFGETVDNGDAFHAFEEALLSTDLDVVALHAHLGGEISTLEQLTSFVDRVLAFADQLHAGLGLNPEILDFGGSLACPTTSPLVRGQFRMNRAFGTDLRPRPPGEVLSISDYVDAVVKRVEAHYRRIERQCPRIFFEPGRAMTANTQFLLTKVMVLKGTGEVTHAILDAGVNLAQSCQNEYHQLFSCSPPRSDVRKLYRLAGPICTPLDILYYGWEFPELASGDVLAIMDSGAYFVPFATSFSFPQPAIVLMENGKERLLRRAETFEDQIALDERSRD